MSVILKVLVLCAVLFLAVKGVGFFTRRLQRRLEEKGSDAATFVPFLRIVLKGLLWFILGSMIIGEIPGLSTLMTSLLASGGILAVVLGLSAQDALGNMLSGIMIAVFKPFRVGDVVRYLSQDVTGTIEEITLRHTVIRTYENKRVLIPNGTINKEIIENADFGDQRIQCVFLVGISYESDIETAMRLLQEEVKGLPDYKDCRTEEERAADTPEVVVRVSDFLDSAVQLRTVFWTESTAASFALKSDLYIAVKKRFAAEGIDIAYPHLVVLEK